MILVGSHWRANENQNKQDETTFNLPEMMHVGATVDSDEMFVQLEECWATPSSDPNHQTKYTFIENFCGTNEEVNVYESLSVAQNGVANQAQFSMESFVFNDSTDAIYLHCNVSNFAIFFAQCIIPYLYASSIRGEASYTACRGILYVANPIYQN